jgi:hypothetical protein
VTALILVRVVLAINLLVVFIQFIFAGEMLGGSDLAVNLHDVTGLVVFIVGLVQLTIFIRLKLRRLCPSWLVVSNLMLITSELIEGACGHSHILWLHVPLGLAIFAGITRQFYWVTREAGQITEASE